MRRSLIMVVAVLMTVGLAGETLGGPQRRQWEETQAYDSPQAVGVDTDIPGVQIGMVEFTPRGARTVEVSVEDDVAPATIAAISQSDEILAVFCTASDGPIKISPKKTVFVNLYAGTCGDNAAFASSGTITVTFSRS